MNRDRRGNGLSDAEIGAALRRGDRLLVTEDNGVEWWYARREANSWEPGVRRLALCARCGHTRHAHRGWPVCVVASPSTGRRCGCTGWTEATA